MNTCFDYSTYLDIPKAILNKDYASEKGVVIRQFKHCGLYIIKYIKSQICEDNISTLGKFRSVITDGKKILCSSPGKSCDFLKFIESTKSDDCAIENFFEGTMINLFYHNDSWELATKGTIGARNKFFQESPHTFRYLFLDAFNKTMNPITNKLWTLDDLNSEYSYTFILQHPSNNIVVQFENPECCLIRKYKLDTWKVTEILTPEYHNQVVPCVYHDKIQNALRLEEDFKNKIFKYDIKGFILFNTVSGLRSKIRNPNYEYVAKLKGNNPKLQYQYYVLKQNNKINEYLYYYPRDKSAFDSYRKEMYNYTNTLWSMYHDCYIKHTKKLKDFPYEYRNHMYFLHQHYLTKLKPNNKYNSLSTVINYVNSLHPSRIMYSINYHHREQHKDKIKTLCPDFINKE